MIKVKNSSFFIAVFSERNKKHVLRVSIELQKLSWKFWRTWKSCENTHLLACVPTAFLVFPNLHTKLYYKTKKKGT